MHSTYDGVAIAYATLSHVAAKGCNTLFVTHYPQVAEELAKEVREQCPVPRFIMRYAHAQYPEQISNWHMSFDEIKSPGTREIDHSRCLLTVRRQCRDHIPVQAHSRSG